MPILTDWAFADRLFLDSGKWLFQMASLGLWAQ